MFWAEIFCKFLCGSATMADGIFRINTHLSEGQTASFKGSKDRVISEATFTDSLRQNFSLYNAFKKFFLAILYQGDDSAETGRTRLCLF